MTKHGWLGSWYAYWVCIARSNLFYFYLYRPWILTYSALAIGVEKDAFEKDNAFGQVAKISLSQEAIVDCLPCKIWSPPDNLFPRYILFILAHPTTHLYPILFLAEPNDMLVIKITAQTILDRSGGHYFFCIVLCCAEPKKIVWGQFDAFCRCCNFYYKALFFSRTLIMDILDW